MKISNDQLNKPGNHIWNSRCNGLHLCCELVPICNISICIWYISYVENYIIIWQVLDELVSSVKCTRIFTTVFIWAITFSLKWNRKKYESFSHQSCYNKLNLANNTHSYKNFALIPRKTEKLYGHMNSAMTRTQIIGKKKKSCLLRRNDDFFFFLLIVSRGKSNEENKLKIVTSLRFYG